MEKMSFWNAHELMMLSEFSECHLMPASLLFLSLGRNCNNNTWPNFMAVPSKQNRNVSEETSHGIAIGQNSSFK